MHGRSDVPEAGSGEEAVRAAYERGETDEFIQPTLVGEEGRIRDGDAVVFFNFRPDRARELTRALGEDDFAEFDRGERPRVPLDHAHELPGGLATTRWPSRRPGPSSRWPRCSPSAASRSCTWPRPRSTRT